MWLKVEEGLSAEAIWFVTMFEAGVIGAGVIWPAFAGNNTWGRGGLGGNGCELRK